MFKMHHRTLIRTLQQCVQNVVKSTETSSFIYDTRVACYQEVQYVLFHAPGIKLS